MIDGETSLFYILDGHNPVPADVQEWAEFCQDFSKTAVGKDTVGDYVIHTMFLGLNPTRDARPPLLFETMIFGPTAWELDMAVWRYPSWGDAERGHAAVVEICAARGAR